MYFLLANWHINNFITLLNKFKTNFTTKAISVFIYFFFVLAFSMHLKHFKRLNVNRMLSTAKYYAIKITNNTVISYTHDKTK